MRYLSIGSLLLSAALILGPVGPAAAIDNVSLTKHNLSSTGSGSYTTTSTTEVCVFCHTPHFGSAAVGVVLWNRATNTATNPYTMYSSSTLDQAIQTQPQGVSLACLSCHDGTIAFDQLINGPGSGNLQTDPVSLGYTWGTAGNSLAGSGATEIGTNLANDHPVSIDVDTPAGGKTQDAGIRTAAQIVTNGLTLYGTNGDQVECASCHNPHEFTNATFLRNPNSNSDLCLDCHIK